ncbi:PREDICTED: probable glycosyltransferase At5g03795 isoform X1 [Nelumbo nucifera]|uniref:Probable glycosyltransferase At5g03795 isoform X1 n=1 Tax=Nelumbo nucifera TaxID=4432 RepID=A0A1U8Q5Q9_NELNU|nr:PREDICTED: probable glycosyltransferase At5g03795 isoform X1 [Nelumbo nucifera]XP_019054134.1 PREDICTED: probable glycosyltransferase At5g03795 isoform X1 [Nelumbo nucifera]
MSFLFPPATVSSHNASVAMVQVNDTNPLVRPQQFSSVSVSSLVSLNSTTGLIQSPPGRVDKKEVLPSSSRRKRRKRVRKETFDEFKVAPPPPKTVPSKWQKYVWSLPPHEALLYAKKEINHAPVVTDDPDLYAALFRNISIFKRSYELMENILKVYIYKDGKRPIFHQPHLFGIYASEGWFMKLMEESRQFVTKDPSKAHLFYLPYSARQMEATLYVPSLHSLQPLSIFLRDYVNMIAAKYPFWNHTRGSDHFLVACHDWGPYTVTAHEELSKNTIKALCNADLSEGIFVAGRDVSLPETTIRNPRKPLREVGGKRVSQRPILAFFAGNMHGRVRPILLKYWKGKDEDMRIYGPLPNRISRKMSYIQHMKSSRFCICPMGYEVNSPRIVEAIYYECVPVIIADNFVPPFNEVLDWSVFSVIVAEKDIPNLKDILLAIPLRRYLSMQTNVKMVQKHFFWNPRPIRYDIFHMILHSIWFNRLNQIQLPQ